MYSSDLQVICLLARHSFEAKFLQPGTLTMEDELHRLEKGARVLHTETKLDDHKTFVRMILI